MALFPFGHDLNPTPAHRKERDERGTASSCSVLLIAAFDRATCHVIWKFPVVFQEVLWHIHVGNQKVALLCQKNPTSRRELLH
jgi:hypothetical protein